MKPSLGCLKCITPPEPEFPLTENNHQRENKEKCLGCADLADLWLRFREIVAFQHEEIAFMSPADNTFTPSDEAVKNKLMFLLFLVAHVFTSAYVKMHNHGLMIPLTSFCHVLVCAISIGSHCPCKRIVHFTLCTSICSLSKRVSTHGWKRCSMYVKKQLLVD